MEYVYGALLLHSVGKEVNEKNLKKVMDASGAKVDDVKVKALISSLEGVNIGDAIKTAAPVATAQAPAAAPVEGKKEEKKEEKKKEEEKTEEEAAAGLASLFG